METTNLMLTKISEVMTMLPQNYYYNDELKAKIVKKCRKIINRGNTFVLNEERDKGGFILDEFLKDNPTELINSTAFWYYDFVYSKLFGNRDMIPVGKNNKIKICPDELKALSLIIVNKLVESKVVPFLDDESETITNNIIQNIFQEYFDVHIE